MCIENDRVSQASERGCFATEISRRSRSRLAFAAEVYHEQAFVVHQHSSTSTRAVFSFAYSPQQYTTLKRAKKISAEFERAPSFEKERRAHRVYASSSQSV